MNRLKSRIVSGLKRFFISDSWSPEAGEKLFRRYKQVRLRGVGVVTVALLTGFFTTIGQGAAEGLLESLPFVNGPGPSATPTPTATAPPPSTPTPTPTPMPTPISTPPPPSASIDDVTPIQTKELPSGSKACKLEITFSASNIPTGYVVWPGARAKDDVLNRIFPSFEPEPTSAGAFRASIVIGPYESFEVRLHLLGPAGKAKFEIYLEQEDWATGVRISVQENPPLDEDTITVDPNACVLV